MQLNDFKVLAFGSSGARRRAVVSFSGPLAYKAGGLTLADIATAMSAAAHPDLEAFLADGHALKVVKTQTMNAGKFIIPATDGVVQIVSMTQTPIGEFIDGTDLSALRLMLFCDCE